MERLPYIDEHRTTIHANAHDTWFALTETARTLLPAQPSLITRLMRLEPPRASGDWKEVRVGDAIPGFEAFDVQPGRRLALQGKHRFSTWHLVFDIDENGSDSILRAQTWAAFPGVAGKIYRLLVITSRAHKLVVRRLARSVAARAHREVTDETRTSPGKLPG